MKNSLLALVGAAIGGFVGYQAFLWGLHQGFYALALPGGLLGLGAGWKKTESPVVAVICGVAALALGLAGEWRSDAVVLPLSEFLMHVHQRAPMSLLMIAIGAVVGFWIPFRSITPAARRD